VSGRCLRCPVGTDVHEAEPERPAASKGTGWRQDATSDTQLPTVLRDWWVLAAPNA